MGNTLNHGVAGYFKAEVYCPQDGRRRLVAPWQKNLITDNGMNKLANGTGPGVMYQALHVGSGTAAPTVTDTTLGAHVASVDCTSSIDASADTDAAQPYVKNTLVFTFAAGQAAGNITELGLAASTAVSGAYPLYTHALFRDGSGNPVTIVVAADEQLIVTYELRVYIPTTPTTATVTNTSTGVAYTISILPAFAGAASSVSSLMSGGLSLGPGSVKMYTGTASGALGPISGTPSGTSQNANASVSAGTYTPGSFYKDLTLTFALTAGNFVDIGGVTSGSDSYSPIMWQFVFSPKITKTADKTLSFSFRFTLTRV